MIKKTLIILAGGQAKRMGKSLVGVAKCSLPIFNTSLLSRQINQAKDVGYKNIIISTNKTYFLSIKRQFKNFKFVRVVSNPKHKYGSLAALLKIIDDNKIKRVIMSFADIFFLENPFGVVSKYLYKKETFLFAAKAFNKKELGCGGIIWADSGRRVTKIFKTPIVRNLNGFRWSGLAIFDANIKKNLEIFLKRNHLPVEEDFFSYLMRNGESVKVDFVHYRG